MKKKLQTDPSSHNRSRILLTGVIGLLVVGGSAGSWILAGSARTPAQRAAEAAAPPPSQITVPVEKRQLRRILQLDCSAHKRLLARWNTEGQSGGGSLVVTGLPPPGKKIDEGDVAIEISGRPIFVIRGRLPSYRDIPPDAEGPDVKQLQESLRRLGLLRGEHRTGVFDRATRKALADLYRTRGYKTAQSTEPAPDPAPTRRGPDEPRPWDSLVALRSELLAVSSLPVEVSRRGLSLGKVVKPGDIVLQGGRPELSCTSRDQPGTKVRVGTRVEIRRKDGRTEQGRVTAVVAAKPAAEEETGRFEGGPEIKVSSRRSLSAGTDYTGVIVLDESPADSLVVPASALWARSGGVTVVRVLRNGRETEIPVEPGFEVDGAVAVSGDGLHEGDEVLVADQNAQGTGS